MSKDKKLKKKSVKETDSISDTTVFEKLVDMDIVGLIANTIAASYMSPVYAIVSNTTDKPTPIELVCMISQSQFQSRYGSLEEWDAGVSKGKASRPYWLWGIDCLNNSIVASTRFGSFLQVSIFPEHFMPNHVNRYRVDLMPDEFSNIKILPNI